MLKLSKWAEQCLELYKPMGKFFMNCDNTQDSIKIYKNKKQF
jgi:hypothetical protein